MSKPELLFNELCLHERETSYLKSTLALLEWDQQTKLPKSADDFRSKQITFLAGQIHQRCTDPRRGDMIGELVDSKLAANVNSDTGATIRELKREYDKQVKLPAKLVESLARAASLGQSIWVQARKDNNFKSFAPHLKEIFSLKQEEADALGWEECRYDALLDEYEPGAKTKEVAKVLDDLRVELVPLVAEIAESSVRPPTEILQQTFPIEAQKKFGREASAKIGFDYDRGRLDVTHHPFCTETGPNDCRITTRYDEAFFNTSFFGTLHEAGHGIYEQGLNPEQYGLPLGKYCSLGIHESQSRLWENLVGRSLSFWEYFFPHAKTHFPKTLANVELDEFHQAINHIAPSLIRVEADEATYNLHIIIRFQLEQSMIDGDLSVVDLPEAWNNKYEQFLGIKPPTDTDGVLQDIHWSAGLIGYFSTYSLGNLYASQFFAAAEQALGDLDAMFRKGDFSPLKNWLNLNVHQPGMRLTGPELGRQVTGNDLSHKLLITQLRQKLSPIYGL
ncbi:MAG: carboxypeptidase M32 [Mariniblastus sp.]|nr:carboxypeptidase M32 [Mariniblastus sp.]